MRHFSGDLEGLRLLMADELELIAGGDGEDTDDVPEPPPTDLGTIVVNANTTYFNLTLGQLLHFYGTGQNTTGGAFQYYVGQPPDCRLTQIEYDATATANPSAQAEAQNFSNAVEEHSDRMRALPPGLTIDHPNLDAPFTTGAELRDLWSRADFTVTGILPPAGYGGGSDPNGGNPIFTTYVGYLPGYMANDARQAWYFFHELAHVTANGVLINQAAIDAWEADKRGVAFADSVYFAANERIMNTVAASLAALFGIDLHAGYPDAPHGYLASGYGANVAPGTLTPDTAGSGPGGTC